MSTWLPPVVDEIKDGEVKLKKLENIDYKTLGDVLTLHLIIEHYLDKFLQENCPKLNWADANLRFSDKVRLFSKSPNGEKNKLTRTLRKFNILRNNFSHNINYKMKKKDIEPFALFLKGFIQKGKKIPTAEIEILNDYTSLVCYWLAGALKLTVRGNWAKRRKEAASKYMSGIKEGLGLLDK